MPEISFLSTAREEFLAAAAYYEAASPGLGAEFIVDVESAVNRLATFPDHGSLYVAGTRRLVLRRFPFDVVYLSSQNQSRHCRFSPSAAQSVLLVRSDLRISGQCLIRNTCRLTK